MPGRSSASPCRSSSAIIRTRPTSARPSCAQWYDTGGVDMVADGRLLGGGTGGRGDRAREAEAASVQRSGHLGHYRAACSPYARALDLRHLFARPRHRLGDRQTGGRSWFFVGADYAFGHALERDTAAVVEQSGGKVLGTVYHPINTADFSSFLLQAQASKAQIIGLANAGGDTINSIKQGASSASSRAGRNSPRSSCSSPTSTASGSRPRRGCSSPPPSTGTWTTRRAPSRGASSSASTTCRP